MIDFLAAAPEHGAVPMPGGLPVSPLQVCLPPLPSPRPAQIVTSGQTGAAARHPHLLPNPGISHRLRLRQVGRGGGERGRAYKTVSLGLQALSIYILWSKLPSLRNLQGNRFDS